LLRGRPEATQRATAADRVIFRDPPPIISPRPRDPAKGLAFRDVAEDRGREHARSAGLEPTTDLAEAVLRTTWYHTIELPNGVTTPGQFDHRPLLARYGLPDDMTGMRALDVATFNGFWAFEMERRGAEVIAIDLDDPHEWDYPKPIKRLVDEIGDMGAINEGYDIAHEALGSSVQRKRCSVYELDPSALGMFDLVHCGDLLLHLREPLAALERMRSVTSGSLLLADGVDADAPGGAYGPTIQYMGGWDDLLWWVPSVDALAQMVVDAGFRDVKVNCVYDLVKSYDSSGFWRASLTATV
jgi:tRNA (mo5U34)-methyltransferase